MAELAVLATAAAGAAASAAPTLATVATIAGTGISALGAIQQGKAAKSAANFKAAQEQMQAQESRAAAQRSALERRREGDFAQSRLQARAAASGGSADDPTAIELGESIAARSEYGALTDVYRGENRARGLEDQAVATRMSGDAAMKGSMFSAAGTILKGAGSMYDRFNPTPSVSASGQGGPLAINEIGRRYYGDYGVGR